MRPPLPLGQVREWAEHGSLSLSQSEMLAAAADEIDRLRADLLTVEAALRDEIERLTTIANALEKEA